MKNCSTLHFLTEKVINHENDSGKGAERVHTYIDNSIRHFLRRESRERWVALEHLLNSFNRL